jgi:hypothetical protein
VPAKWCFLRLATATLLPLVDKGGMAITGLLCPTPPSPDNFRLAFNKALTGAANPDASLVRARAVEQLKTATEKDTAALRALTDAIIHYQPR